MICHLWGISGRSIMGGNKRGCVAEVRKSSIFSPQIVCYGGKIVTWAFSTRSSTACAQRRLGVLFLADGRGTQCGLLLL